MYGEEDYNIYNLESKELGGKESLCLTKNTTSYRTQIKKAETANLQKSQLNIYCKAGSCTMLLIKNGYFS